ncbi:ABC-ATPase domain-containing protein [Egbenema bharatensis]|uniref:ABC-ATPase domain-containing protein n=1 Tax=Egbenema bharatensis TaxID=3463334 RepID=UPI003A86FF06
MSTSRSLYDLLLDLDQRSYKAYKDIQGSYQFPDFLLIIDHVQGDPFAAPSRLRVQVPQSKAGFPQELYATPSREIALRDYLNRQFDRSANNLSGKRGSGKSGLIAIARPKQQVLERTAILIDDRTVEARFAVGLPARGRSILGRQAAELLCEDLPEIVDRSLKFAALNAKAIQQQIETVEDADWLRAQLADRGLVAFIPDGAILPRRSGVDDRPLASASAQSAKPQPTAKPASPFARATPAKALQKPPQVATPDEETPVPFESPDSLRVEFDRPNQGKITGMGIPRGVTLIVGGGYHGKSTLLKAIALGVYNHIPGDGREQIVTDPGAVKIRAEDGRSIVGVNISPFINRLPQGRSTAHFSSENASGSTSQAANIMEALEVGATVLLVDEDTSATNFMIRDRRMQALIAKDKEPITPFIDKIRQLYDDCGVSTILVMGGSGDYFDVANTVIAMTDYEPSEVTERAKQIAQDYATDRAPEGGEAFGQITPRIPVPKRLDSPKEKWSRGDRGDRGRGRGGRWGDEGEPEEKRELRDPKLKVRDVDELVFGTEEVDLAAVEQVVDVGQLRAIGAAMTYIQQHYLDGKQALPDIVERVMQDIAKGELDILTPYPQGDLMMFRSFELAAVMNRLRSLEVK